MQKKSRIISFIALCLTTVASTSYTFAATPSTLAGVPIGTFCTTYAKDLMTKSVAIGIILKIKADPTRKESLMRQYATFLALGKQYCKAYIPLGQLTIITVTNPTLDTDLTHNTPIISTGTTQHFLTSQDYFTGYDTTLLHDLTDQETQITLQRIEKAKETYANIINDFIAKKRLLSSDRDNMVGKIAFNLSNNCNELDGKILVRQWFDQNHALISTELVNLFITINLCFQPSYDEGYDTFIKRIVYHELGHYLDYFHDDNDVGFKNFCRSGTQNNCSDTSFITPYAESAPDEDYAETFSYYVQDGSPVSNPILQQKINYFAAKFPK